ncbi:MAG: hypothetical protein ACKPKO_27370, partial [Candidatus Fonsibacter sp.]
SATNASECCGSGQTSRSQRPKRQSLHHIGWHHRRITTTGNAVMSILPASPCIFDKLSLRAATVTVLGKRLAIRQCNIKLRGITKDLKQLVRKQMV